MSIVLTPAAVAEVKKIKQAQNLGDETFVRMVIAGGGCRGMEYGLGFDTTFDPLRDARYDIDTVSVVALKEFDLFLDGTEVNFVETPNAKGFAIDNPNFPAGAGCAGCGAH